MDPSTGPDPAGDSGPSPPRFRSQCRFGFTFPSGGGSWVDGFAEFLLGLLGERGGSPSKNWVFLKVTK